MANETIELLKGYEPKKMEFPAVLSEKLDGVPVVISRTAEGDLIALTRQGETLKSIEHILHELEYGQGNALAMVGSFLVGELYIKDVPFKEISGKVRRHAPAPDLTFNIFDGNLRPDLYQRYFDRLQDINWSILSNPNVSVIPYRVVKDAVSADDAFMVHMEVYPKSEGMVLHSCSKVWSPGKRCWGTQRIKPNPTLDLVVDRYYEAVSEAGEGLNMVGRIDVHYDRQVKGARVLSSVIGIGPGSLTHAERRSVWAAAQQIINSGGPRRPVSRTVIEVKYMTDDTYDALRQPTFVRWRPDKNVGDVHHVG